MMNTLKKLAGFAAMACGLLLLGACSDDVTVGTVDESTYDTSHLNAYLREASNGRTESVVEMTGKEYKTSVYVGLNKLPMMGVDVKVAVDDAYAAAYNKAHETDFETFPAENVTIENDGAFLLAPDDKESQKLDVTLTAFDGMEEDKTYLLPLKVTSTTAGVSLDEASSHMVMLVKKPLGSYSSDGSGSHDKGADIQTVLYFEVNDTNPLNALEFKTASGKYFFDHIVLFAANINYDAEKKKVYLYNNPNVQFLLDHNEEYLQPLRKAGMKVIISILGNHDAAGVAQLSDMGAKAFAKELAAYCKAYNLDGVAFDDEYSQSPDLSNPWFARASAYAGSRLAYECKVAMPDKLVTLYNLGNMYSSRLEVIDGIEPGQYCDYAVGDYGTSARPGTGMTLKQCGGMSVELRRGSGNSSESGARSVKNNGYGYFMFFALDPSLYGSQVGRCQTVCKGLYDEELIYPPYYYSKNSTERKATR